MLRFLKHIRSMSYNYCLNQPLKLVTGSILRVETSTQVTGKIQHLPSGKFSQYPTLGKSISSAKVQNGRDNYVVVSTDLKNISQNGSLPQVGVKIKDVWNHHIDNILND